MRKESQHEEHENLASLKWQRKRTIFPLESENIIGKSNACDIVVKATTIKNHHFSIYIDCGEWIILPYKKAQVYINKYLIEEKTQLSDGDKISAGKENFIFSFEVIEEEDDDV